MKLTILCENETSHKGSKICLSEWGLSFWVETKNTKILFDTGRTDVYKNNAEKLNINLEDANFIILSHHHFDHAKGLQHHDFKTKKKLIIHPEIISKLPQNESKKIKSDFEVVVSKKVLEFSKNIYYLGEIPRETNFEKGTHRNDLMLDDSAIAIKTKNGTVVITGCSHSGICNICQYAKKITKQKIYAVIGGFHLFEGDQKIVNGTIKYFKKEKPKYLYPMHCVDFPTLCKFYSTFKIKKLSTGDSIEFEN